MCVFVTFANPYLSESVDEYQINEMLKSDLGGIILKTCSLNNGASSLSSEDKEYIMCDESYTVDYEYYKNIILTKMSVNKPIILSIIDDGDFEYILKDFDMTLRDYSLKVLVEINMSCSNSKNKINGYHSKDIRHVLEKIQNLSLQNIGIGLRLPPFFELYKIRKISSILNIYKNIVKFIVCSNGISNTILNEKILNSISGNKINKLISLNNIVNFKKNLDKDIMIIGCGGIINSMDIFEYLELGATMVQIESQSDDETINSIIKNCE